MGERLEEREREKLVGEGEVSGEGGLVADLSSHTIWWCETHFPTKSHSHTEGAIFTHSS